MQNELKTKIMITRKYLSDIFELLGDQIDLDAKKEIEGNTLPAAIKVDSIGVISLSVRNIEYEMKQIEDAINLAEDMEKELAKAS